MAQGRPAGQVDGQTLGSRTWRKAHGAASSEPLPQAYFHPLPALPRRTQWGQAL